MRTKCILTAISMACFSLMLTLGLSGDLRYQETHRISGGMMEGVTKVMGFFGAKGLDNTSSTVYIKGDLMRSDTFLNNEMTQSSIIRLDREEIINVEHKKKSYSVLTFAEMRQQMQKAVESLKKPATDSQESKTPEVKVEPKISVKDTGESKVINGFSAHHFILSVQLETQDANTKDKGSLDLVSDVWVAKDVSGFEEQREFFHKYALKMGYAQMSKDLGISPAAQDPRMMRAMEELSKETAKMDGVPVLTIAALGGSGTPSAETQQAQAAAPSSANSDSKEDDRESPAKESVGKSLGKVLGGFGGFGKKKKKEEPAKPTSERTAPVDSASTPGGSVSMNLMTMTTELKSVSSETLSANLFEVPQGYKRTQQ